MRDVHVATHACPANGKGNEVPLQIDKCRAILTINPTVFGSKAGWGHTLSMLNKSSSQVPFAELPSEARALLFIFALGAAGRYVGHPPKQSELNPIIESIWNRNRLCHDDLADPFQMTALLKAEFASVSFAGGGK
jgi:hypothetical protein